MPDDTDAAIGQLSSALRLNAQDLDVLNRFPAAQTQILAGAAVAAFRSGGPLPEELVHALELAPPSSASQG